MRGVDCQGGGRQQELEDAQGSEGHCVVLSSEGPARLQASDQSAGDPRQPVIKSEGFAVRLAGASSRITMDRARKTGKEVSEETAAKGKDMQALVVELLVTSHGREATTKTLEDGMLASSTRATKEAKLNTLLKFAAAGGFELFSLTVEKLSPILGAMKMADYRSAVTYLSEARVRHVQLQQVVSDQPNLYFKDAARAVVRGRGPVKRAPVVKLEEIV